MHWRCFKHDQAIINIFIKWLSLNTHNCMIKLIKYKNIRSNLNAALESISDQPSAIWINVWSVLSDAVMVIYFYFSKFWQIRIFRLYLETISTTFDRIRFKTYESNTSDGILRNHSRFLDKIIFFDQCVAKFMISHAFNYFNN